MNVGLPRDLREVLPEDTARTWVLLRDHLPKSMVLYGGTALAAHLHHRVSRDLDFFSAGPLGAAALKVTLESLGYRLRACVTSLPRNSRRSTTAGSCATTST